MRADSSVEIGVTYCLDRLATTDFDDPLIFNMVELKWLQSDWMDFFFTQGSRLVLVICDSVSRHFPIAAKIASRHGQAQQIEKHK